VAMLYKQASFNVLYDKYSTQLINEYCEARLAHNSHDVALYLARISVMDSLIYAIHREYKNRFILFKVHKTIREDQSLNVKALRQFNLA